MPPPKPEPPSSRGARGGPYAALADPTRRAILKLLRKGSLSAGEIAATFDLSKPTLSHHFRALEDAGLVRAERHGTRVVFTLQTSVLEDVATELLELASGIARRSPKPSPG